MHRPQRCYACLCHKGELAHVALESLNLAPYGLIVGAVDKVVARVLVASDAHLRVDVVLEAVVVAIQVVGGDVHQHRDVSLETEHTVQLER